MDGKMAEFLSRRRSTGGTDISTPPKAEGYPFQMESTEPFG